MSIVLGIETATSEVGAALCIDGEVVAEARSSKGRRHAESLAPQIEFIASQAQIALADIDAIAADIGPGLFTGLRVGVTTAATMARALGIQVVAVTSLEALAAASMGAHDVVAAIDARRGELFVQRFIDGVSIDDPAIVTPSDLAASLVAGQLVIGDGVAAHRDVFNASEATIAPAQHPSAAAIAAIGSTRLAGGAALDPAALTPLYLRGPDAIAKFG